METITLERTKTGLPCAWERGGGYTNTGESVVIASADGSPKKATYVRTAGHLSNGNHALFVVEKGDIVVMAWHHRHDYTIKVFRIVEIRETDKGFVATLDIINKYDRGEWDKDEPAGKIGDAVEAAAYKAAHYHCRSPYYLKPPTSV